MAIVAVFCTDIAVQSLAIPIPGTDTLHYL